MPVVSFYRLHSFLCFLFIIVIAQASAQPKFLDYFCDYKNISGNYTANSNYHTNLNILLSNLSSNTEIDYGFYNFSYGQNSDDKVNAIGLCRGDVKPDECRRCLDDSRVNLTKLCPNQKAAMGWLDNCMLRYTNRPIFRLMETDPEFWVWNELNVTEWNQFNQVLQKLMESLKSRAASGDSRRKYAAASASGPNSQQIYGLVQCTPDLSGLDCDQCLTGAISKLPDCCTNRRGGRVITPSCNIRYEIDLFYDPTAEAPTPSPPPALSRGVAVTPPKLKTFSIYLVYMAHVLCMHLMKTLLI